MRCPECGQLLTENARRCPACGITIDMGYANESDYSEYQDVTVEEIEENTDDSNQYYYAESETYDQTAMEYRARSWREEKKSFDMPMKWYWFLTRISLLLTAVMNVVQGYQVIIGQQYYVDGQQLDVYGTYPLMRPCDIVYGIFLVAFGLFAFYVRHQLMRHKRKATFYVVILYAVSAVITVTYSGLTSLVTGINLMDSTILFSAGLSIILAILNKVYFDKRAHIFKY